MAKHKPLIFEEWFETSDYDDHTFGDFTHWPVASFLLIPNIAHSNALFFLAIIVPIIIVFLQVLMKDVATPVPQNEVRAVIKKSLENAALVNYERLSEEARIEGEYRPKKTSWNQINYHFPKKIHEISFFGL